MIPSGTQPASIIGSYLVFHIILINLKTVHERFVDKIPKPSSRKSNVWKKRIDFVLCEITAYLSLLFCFRPK